MPVPNRRGAATAAAAATAQAGGSREQILHAARRVFARRGYHGASINEIAAEAGFSKGALYWNFASKEELFFALLDDLDEQLRGLMALSATPPSAGGDLAEELSRDLSAVLEEGQDVVLLFHEYSALAVRDPTVAARYAQRNRRIRAWLADVLTARYAAMQIAPGISPEHIATTMIALVDGLSIQQLTEPEAVPPDLFGQILCLIDDGLTAQAKERT